MKIPNAEDALPISKSVNLPKVHKEQLCEKLLNTIPATMMYPLIKGWKSCIYILTTGTIGMLATTYIVLISLEGKRLCKTIKV